jgi:hypothetical protein
MVFSHTAKIYRTSLLAFLKHSSNSPVFFHPKVVYDEHAGRFLVVALQQDNAQQVSHFFLAVCQKVKLQMQLVIGTNSISTQLNLSTE